MEFVEKNRRLKILPDKERILEIMGCNENDLLYKSVSEEYDTLFNRMADSLNVMYSICCEKDRVYVTLTAGKEISYLSAELFDNGEGLAGLIVNNAADNILFEADKIISERIKYLCAKWGKGVKDRLEPPNGAPLTEQAVILRKAEIEGVSITDGFMLSPAKSMAYELILTEDESIFKAQHDCSTCPNKNCPRRSVAENSAFEIVSDFDFAPTEASGIAIDIGTTTIAAVRLENGRIAAAHSELNTQRRFGADVLSRIEAANRGRGDELKSAIEYQLKHCIDAVDGDGLRTIIAGNTTMVSLLLGYDCTELGVYPFKAQNLDTVHNDKTSIVGGISAFVGGDITSGLYMCGFSESEEISLFVDLGTNAEMAIGNKDRILCTSAAAGPAFEGGRITCGIGSVEGAVCAVSLSENRIDTIGGKKPRGICGSGIVELVSELIDNGHADKTGLLKERYSSGFKLADEVVFTQADMRELQTAKAAVRSGIETLIKEYGADEAKIKQVYIGGGFGKRLNIKKACNIGLLPERFEGRYRAVGNCSLGGCARLLENENGFEKIDKIKGVSEDFPLAQNEIFTELFVKYMGF